MIQPGGHNDLFLQSIGFNKNTLSGHPHPKIPEAPLYRRSDIKMAIEEYQHAISMDLQRIALDQDGPTADRRSSVSDLKSVSIAAFFAFARANLMNP